MRRRDFIGALGALSALGTVPAAKVALGQPERQHISEPEHPKMPREWFEEYAAKYGGDRVRWACVTNERLARMINRFNSMNGKETDWSQLESDILVHNRYFYEFRRYFDLDVSPGWESRLSDRLREKEAPAKAGA